MPDDPLDPNDYPGVIRNFDFTTLVSVAQNDDDEGETSRVEFDVIEETYYFAVDGANDAKGLAVLNYAFESELSTSSQAASFESAGQSIRLSSLTNNASSGTTRINWVAEEDGVANLQASDAIFGTSLKVYAENEHGNLKLVSGGSYADTNQFLASTSFKVSEGERYVIEVLNPEENSAAGATLDLNLDAARDRPKNDDFSKRATIRGNQVSQSISLSGATSELGEPMHAPLPPPQKSVWWKWTAPSDGDLSLGIQNGDYQTKIALYAGWSR